MRQCEFLDTSATNEAIAARRRRSYRRTCKCLISCPIAACLNPVGVLRRGPHRCAIRPLRHRQLPGQSIEREQNANRSRPGAHAPRLTHVEQTGMICDSGLESVLNICHTRR
jgi:hypothetical protein